MWGPGVLPTALPAPLSASLSPALLVYLCKCGAAGSASVPGHRPTLYQSRSRHGNVSPLRPGCPSPPLLPVWMNVYFVSPWCQTPLPLDFLSVLVVRGGAVCLPTPPSWFSVWMPFNTAFSFCLQSLCLDFGFGKGRGFLPSLKILIQIIRVLALVLKMYFAGQKQKTSQLCGKWYCKGSLTFI